MKRWSLLIAAGAVGVVVLVGLVLQGSSGPARRAGHPPPQPPRDPAAAPPAPAHADEVPEPAVEADDQRNASIPGTERWHYEQFLQKAAADPAAFDRLVAETVRSGAPLEQRIALLRAAWKVRGPKALPWFADAYAAGAGAPEATEALRGFVVRHLASQAQADRGVRAFLTESVFLAETASDRDRSAAVRGVLRIADPGEIAALLDRIQGISDPEIIEGALVGLGSNASPDAAAALTWLSLHHPEKSVRERAAEISRRRLAGDVEEQAED